MLIIIQIYFFPCPTVQHCHGCKVNFERTGLHKHHCRGCGEGFCNPCSMHKMPVPARSWLSPVRVCNACKDVLSKKYDARPGKPIKQMTNTHIQFDIIANFPFKPIFHSIYMKLCDCPQYKNQYKLNKFNQKNIINQTKPNDK